MRIWMNGAALLTAMLAADVAAAQVLALPTTPTGRCGSVHDVPQSAVAIGTVRSVVISEQAAVSIADARFFATLEPTELSARGDGIAPCNTVAPSDRARRFRDAAGARYHDRDGMAGEKVAAPDAPVLAVATGVAARAVVEKDLPPGAQPAPFHPHPKIGGDDRLTMKMEGTPMIKAILTGAVALGTVAVASPALAGPAGVVLKGKATINATQQGAFTAVATGVGASAIIDNGRIGGNVQVDGDVEIKATQQGAFTAVSTGVGAKSRISNGVITSAE